MNNNNKLRISTHTLSVEVKRVTHTEEPYSSLSSSTSSITTLDDDLSQELENIWKIKSPKHHQIKSDVQHQDLFLQLLVSQAMIDAQDYQILSFEKLESLKEVCVHVKNI